MHSIPSPLDNCLNYSKASILLKALEETVLQGPFPLGKLLPLSPLGKHLKYSKATNWFKTLEEALLQVIMDWKFMWSLETTSK